MTSTFSNPGFRETVIRFEKQLQARNLQPRKVASAQGLFVLQSAVAAIRQLGMEDKEVEDVQSGTIFDGGALISEPMRQLVLTHAPKARLIRLRALPAVGAAILGMQVAGFDGYAVRPKMIRTSDKLVK